MKAINIETKEEIQFMINDTEFVYGTVVMDNTIAKVGDYLVIKDDKLVEVLSKEEFYGKYTTLS